MLSAGSLPSGNGSHCHNSSHIYGIMIENNLNPLSNTLNKTFLEAS